MYIIYVLFKKTIHQIKPNASKNDPRKSDRAANTFDLSLPVAANVYCGDEASPVKIDLHTDIVCWQYQRVVPAACVLGKYPQARPLGLPGSLEGWQVQQLPIV